MRTSRYFRARFALSTLFLALSLLPAAGAFAQKFPVQMKEGNSDPGPVTFVAPIAGLTKGVAFSGTAKTIANDKTTVLTPQGAPSDLAAKAWDFDVANQTLGDQCTQISANADGTLALDMARIDCPGFIRQGTLIEVQSGGQAAYFVMNNRIAPQRGDDMGIALTLIDRWKEKDASGQEISKGARVSSGVNVYYSLSNLKTNFVRLIGSASLLDADPAIDMEVGIGLGVLFRTPPLGGSDTAGVGVAAGVGYNLMLDDSDQRWYTFFGFSMNFNRQGGNP